MTGHRGTGVRAGPGRHRAVPIAWSRLDDPRLDARHWTIADAVEQARTKPWAGLPSHGRAFGPAWRRLNSLRPAQTRVSEDLTKARGSKSGDSGRTSGTPNLLASKQVDLPPRQGERTGYRDIRRVPAFPS